MAKHLSDPGNRTVDASRESSPHRHRGDAFGSSGRRLTTADGRVIVVARYAGYCYGVQRALRLALEASENVDDTISTLGPLIHNPAVVEDLARRGVRAVESPQEVDGGTVLVRTHGVPPAVVETARARGLRVIDATCPFVTVAQRKAAALAQDGYIVVILGERDHPEVAGITACAGTEALVVEEAGELDPDEVTDRRVGIVVQTTQTYAALAALAAAVAPLARETLVYNTICEATEQRQEAAREMARQVDCVVVVGGRNSANTRRLASLCREIQPRTRHLERASELSPGWVAGCQTVGITAGASTPEEEIEATVAAIAAVPLDR
jgi:4-hydroxy-3-methylbut-2-enyl diphosphate reductase